MIQSEAGRRLASQTSVKRAFLAFVLAALIVAALASFVGCSCSSETPASSNKIESLEASDTPSVGESDQSQEAVESPVDFKALQEQNGDVYAWLYVPDTAVNHPVLQNQFADNYYLVHDAYGNSNGLGAMYTQSFNSLSFKDPVTVIYGHTFEVYQEGLSEEMMSTLHYFEDEQFFNEHPNFYIYTPDKMFTYEIIAAYEYDNRHIMNSFDFNDAQVTQDFFNSVANPDSMVKNVREETLTAGEDHIVILSTCTRPANDAARYLIAGVLVNEQPVK